MVSTKFPDGWEYSTILYYNRLPIDAAAFVGSGDTICIPKIYDFNPEIFPLVLGCCEHQLDQVGTEL